MGFLCSAADAAASEKGEGGAEEGEGEEALVAAREATREGL